MPPTPEDDGQERAENGEPSGSGANVAPTYCSSSTSMSARAQSPMTLEEEEEALYAAASSSAESDISARSTSFDPNFDSDMSRYPASVTSSIRAHVYEGGLRYHAYRDGKYPFPNDDVEQNRDDMKHTMSLMLCRGAHFYAPVEDMFKNGAQVLDLGTGTGIWAMELGDKYPAAEITGIDLSPIQPNYVPENVHFFVDDFEEEWLDPENKYDYIHVRYVVHSVRDMKGLIQKAMHHLKPGGYLEFQELHFYPRCDDETMTAETPYALRDFYHYMEDGMRAMGYELHAVLSLTEELQAAGFENVRSRSHKTPIGLWPRDKRLRLCGLFMRTAIMDGLRGLSRRPFLALGWTQLQIEMFLVDVRKATMNGMFHTFFTFHGIYGQKPLDGGQGSNQQSATATPPSPVGH